MGKMAIMTAREGHQSVTWDPTVEDEVRNAEARFQEFSAQGYNAYKVDEGKTDGEQIKEFDAQAFEILLAPQMQGG